MLVVRSNMGKSFTDCTWGSTTNGQEITYGNKVAAEQAKKEYEDIFLDDKFYIMSIK